MIAPRGTRAGGAGGGLERRRSKVRTGTIGVNGYVNDPFAPFGGVKSSGMGRELGPEGLQPFQLLKTIYLDEPNDAA
jgi:aldehyde dehydrogenase (NAD+)